MLGPDDPRTLCAGGPSPNGYEGVFANDPTLKGNPYVVDTDEHGFKPRFLRGADLVLRRRAGPVGRPSGAGTHGPPGPGQEGEPAPREGGRPWLLAGARADHGEGRLADPRRALRDPAGHRRAPYVEEVHQVFRQGIRPGDGAFRTVLEVTRGRAHRPRGRRAAVSAPGGAAVNAWSWTPPVRWSCLRCGGWFSKSRIGRPRRIYTGPTARKYVPINQR